MQLALDLALLRKNGSAVLHGDLEEQVLDVNVGTTNKLKPGRGVIKRVVLGEDLVGLEARNVVVHVSHRVNAHAKLHQEGAFVGCPRRLEVNKSYYLVKGPNMGDVVSQIDHLNTQQSLRVLEKIASGKSGPNITGRKTKKAVQT